jgi:hypothetical protein
MADSTHPPPHTSSREPTPPTPPSEAIGFGNLSCTCARGLVVGKTDRASHWHPRPLATQTPKQPARLDKSCYARYVHTQTPKPASSPIRSIYAAAAPQVPSGPLWTSHHSRDGIIFQHPSQPLSSCSIRKRNAATVRQTGLSDMYHPPQGQTETVVPAGWPRCMGVGEGKLLVGTNGLSYGRLAANRRGADLRTGGCRDPLVQCARQPLPGAGQCPSPVNMICREGRGPKELQEVRASVACTSTRHALCPWGRGTSFAAVPGPRCQ